MPVRMARAFGKVWNHWALQEANTSSVSSEKPSSAEVGAAKSAAFRGGSFAEAIAAVEVA
jgi:hypothetical protein